MVITNIIEDAKGDISMALFCVVFCIFAIKSPEVIFTFNVLIIEPLNNGNISINAQCLDMMKLSNALFFSVKTCADIIKVKLL